MLFSDSKTQVCLRVYNCSNRANTAQFPVNLDAEESTHHLAASVTQTQIHSTSRSVPFYLFKSATWSPSPSIKSAVRNCREQHSSLSLKSPFSSTLLLSRSQARQLHNSAEPRPWDAVSQEWDVPVSLKSCGTDTQHFLSFWRVTKLPVTNHNIVTQFCAMRKITAST